MGTVASYPTFLDAASRYWILVRPRLWRELRHWQRRAGEIPDPRLQAVAREMLRCERGNYEGAAAFAAFAPWRARASVVRAVVAFQLAYDYVDSLAERATPAPGANARALHHALLAALSARREPADYYAHSGCESDGGYLDDLVSRCRAAFTSLPSHAVVERPLRRAVQRMVEYQALIHDHAARTRALATWGRAETPRGSGLAWWEAAAGGASSLVAFALIAAAARPGLPAREAEAIERAYFPWVGSLHVLLDSLVDWPQDVAVGHPSLIAHYSSPAATAARMQSIARSAFDAARALPQPRQHTLFLAAMTGFYLAKPAARLPHAAETTERLTAALGGLARPVLLVHRARGRIAR